MTSMEEAAAFEGVRRVLAAHVLQDEELVEAVQVAARRIAERGAEGRFSGLLHGGRGVGEGGGLEEKRAEAAAGGRKPVSTVNGCHRRYACSLAAMHKKQDTAAATALAVSTRKTSWRHRCLPDRQPKGRR